MFSSNLWFLLVAACIILGDSTLAQDVPDRGQIELRTRQLRKAIESRRARLGSKDSLPCAEVFCKAAEWALRFDPSLSDSDLRLLRQTLARGDERLKELESGSAPWDAKRGRLVRAFVSDVDGSVQPYGLIVPKSYEAGRPIRLDVVLHGSSQPSGMSEARFMSTFEESDSGSPPPDVNYLEFHPLGRVENCYRWAGETDVFEAIEDVCRHYSVDRDRIVLRGMSMGASGTWHLGLKHPDSFVAIGPYCGYVDTHRFSETPGMNFVRVGPLPDYQELGLHMLDSVDYAANAGIVPAIAAIGEKDPFFQAHVIMGEAFRKEGLIMVNLISPGTGHVQEPKTFAEQMRRIEEISSRGLDRKPRHMRFVTWTLKYNRCHWIELLELNHHYHRSEIDASWGSDGVIRLKEPSNVACMAIYPPASAGSVFVGNNRIPIPRSATSNLGFILRKRNGQWKLAGTKASNSRLVGQTGKRPGIQGPIDDAFTSRFLCVRPTGKPWNDHVNDWAVADLNRFAYEWARYFRGDLPIKDDTAVTESDRRTCNLILFGDPGSNRLIREALRRLPLKWTRDSLLLGGSRYDSGDHSPVLIAPSPFSPNHYVVVNNGHTFHEAELNRLNYLLFPRLGDWAVIDIGAGKPPSNPSEGQLDKVVQAGYFDEQWRDHGK